MDCDSGESKMRIVQDVKEPREGFWEGQLAAVLAEHVRRNSGIGALLYSKTRQALGDHVFWQI